MNVQTLLTGKTFVEYGEPVDYQSPLWVVSSSEAEIFYSDVPHGTPIARVYKKHGERGWWLSTVYLCYWQPLTAASKYEAFLTLLIIKKQNEL
jgi:hypothetical protein